MGEIVKRKMTRLPSLEFGPLGVHIDIEKTDNGYRAYAKQHSDIVVHAADEESAERTLLELLTEQRHKHLQREDREFMASHPVAFRSSRVQKWIEKIKATPPISYILGIFLAFSSLIVFDPVVIGITALCILGAGGYIWYLKDLDTGYAGVDE